MSHSLSAVSFRDPAGFVYRTEGDLRRQINQVYREHYDQLMTSGLYDELVAERLLIPTKRSRRKGLNHRRLTRSSALSESSLYPTPMNGASAQLQDAALVALEVQRRALLRGMTLKDCSVYNIQFHHGPADLHRHSLVRDLPRGRAVVRLQAVLRALPRPPRTREPDRLSSRPALPNEHRWHPA